MGTHQSRHITNTHRVQEKIWKEVLKREGEKFFISDIAEATKTQYHTVKNYFRHLRTDGFIRPLEAEREKQNSKMPFELMKVQKTAPLKKRSYQYVNENIWRTIKMIGHFTAQDLAIAASSKRDIVSKARAEQMIYVLKLAGYLKTIREHRPGVGGRNAVYRLLPGKNTGPYPPYLTKDKRVYDPNLDRIVWEPETGGCHEQLA